MNKVIGIVELAMQVNELGKDHVFVNIAPHVKSIDIIIMFGGWGSETGRFYKTYYYKEPFMDDKSNLAEIKTKLLELIEKERPIRTAILQGQE